MLRNLTIKTKLIASFIIICVLLIILSTYSITGLNESSDGFSEYRGTAKDAVLASRVQANMLQMRMHVKDYFKSSSQEDIDKFNTYFTKTEEFVKIAVQEIQHPKRAPLIKDIQQELQNYKSNFLQVITFMNKRNEIVDTNLNVNGKKIEELLSSVVNSARNDGDKDGALATAKGVRLLLLARLYTSKFLMSNNDMDAKRAIDEFAQLTSNFKELENSIQNPVRKKQLVEVSTLLNQYI